METEAEKGATGGQRKRGAREVGEAHVRAKSAREGHGPIWSQVGECDVATSIRRMAFKI